MTARTIAAADVKTALGYTPTYTRAGSTGIKPSGIIIPYYVYVANPYNDAAFSGLLTLIRTYQNVPVIVIVNQPGVDGLGGPGPLADAAVAQMIRMLRAAGATICGYVSTQNATRSATLVQADILSWNSLYPTAPLDGVFFDELPYAVGTANANITLYKSYYDYAHANGYALVIGNPGSQLLSPWYDAKVADIYCCYENTSWPTLASFLITPPQFYSGATTDYPRESFATLIYNSAWSASGYQTLVPYFGWIYATDNPSPASIGSPWAALSSYLATLFAAASGAGTVNSFNTRTGAVTLTLGDVTGTGVMAAPGPIGGTTPNTGAFTTLSATSTVSGAGFTAWAASPPAIGGTAANTGRFSTLTTTLAYTPSQTSGIVGTTTNNNANAGSFGEVISSTLLVGSAVSLTNGTASTVTSISLTAGDWDVRGEVWMAIGTGGATVGQGGISSTAATLPGTPGTGSRAIVAAALTASQSLVLPLDTCRFSLSATTTIYLIAALSFPSGTSTAYGTISARRAR